MTTVKKPVILLAAAAAMSMAFAKALVHAETPEPSKVGGETVLGLHRLETRHETPEPSKVGGETVLGLHRLETRHETPEPSKVGGQTAILTEAKWQQSSNLASLEYRDESVAPSALSHDEPLCRVSIRNLLPVQRTLKITANCQQSSDSEKTLTLEPMATATVTLPLAFANESTYAGVHYILVNEPNPPKITGNDNRYPDSVNLANRVTDYDDDGNPSLLLSEGITRDSILPSFKKDFDTLELRRKADEWPRDYRAYLPFDAVCLADDLASALPEETRTALRAYKLLGGSVLTMPDGAHHPKDIQATAATARNRRKGDLSVSGYRWASKRNSFSHNVARVPISVGRSLPTEILIGLLALVAIIVMPATVWYCAKKNRRLLLLAALPGFALAMTVLVALVALAAYGLTPTTRLQATTILDPTSHLAVTRGQFAVFSPVQITAKMSIPTDASFRLRGREDRASISAVYGETCRLKGDWIKPLTATFFDFERAERRSERLDVKRGKDGAIVVANLLGTPIVDGYVQLDGKRYKVPALAPGEEASVKGEPFATIPDNRYATPADELADMLLGKDTNYGRDWDMTQRIAENGKKPIPDGTYVVRLTGSPFLPSPLAEIETRETVASVVAGCIPAESGKEVSK